MATAVRVSDDSCKRMALKVIDVTLSSSYATGGELVPALPLNVVAVVVAHQPAGYVAEYVPATSLLKMFRQKNPADAGGADIPMPEVANAANLSAVTARLLVFYLHQ